jgi:phosphonopyruvate decarboxylase
MLRCADFLNLFLERKINFFTGVPDSLLKDFLNYLTNNIKGQNHIIAANEGNAIALAVGYYLSTGKIGLVYMQNSGLNNALNPLTSLVNKEVYGIPVLLLIGWRGKPGEKDEPEHVKPGLITKKLLKTLDIPFSVLPKSLSKCEKIVEKALNYMTKYSLPYAIIVRRGTFESYHLNNLLKKSLLLSREEAIKLIVNNLSAKDIIVSTTGMASRELYECRNALKQTHNRDFLNIGSMGHCSQIALKIALSKPKINIYCLDGDGSIIMHMGALAIIGSQRVANFKHIILNNGAHDSVGGQPTVGLKIDIPTIARACGYVKTYSVKTEKEIINKMRLLKKIKGAALLEIKVKGGSRKNLSRPITSPLENKKAFMKFLGRN